MTRAELKHLIARPSVNAHARELIERVLGTSSPAVRKNRREAVRGVISGREPVEVVLPVRTRTECNTNETHWAKSKRERAQRDMVVLMMQRIALPELPVRVTLTRCGPGTLDTHDNLPSSNKHIVDQIADLYGVADCDHRIGWVYSQVKRKQYGVIVRIEAA